MTNKRKITADIPITLYEEAQNAMSEDGAFSGQTLGRLVAEGLRLLLSGNAVELRPETAELIRSRTKTGIYRDRPVDWMVDESVLCLLAPPEKDAQKHIENLVAVIKTLED